MIAAAHILIVDDEQDLAATLAFNLQREGCSTQIATNGQLGLQLAAQKPPPSLIILDLMLPDLSGTEVCKRLRANNVTAGIPILMLTAKDDEIDRVVGFEVGADDYVTKPFSVRELILRIKAILRRGSSASQIAPSTGDEFSFGKLRVDRGAHRIWVDEEEIALTALEFRLLVTLHSRKGRVQTRETLLHDVWGIQANVTTRTVDTHVRRLRQKLGEEVSGYIETLRGVGYRFCTDPSETAESSGE